MVNPEKMCHLSDKQCEEDVASQSNNCENCKILQAKVRVIERIIQRWKPSALAIAAAKEK